MRKPVYAICDPRSLISVFVVRCLESIIPLFSIPEISSLCLASVAAQAGLCLTWSQSPKIGFLVTRLILFHLTSFFVRLFVTSLHYCNLVEGYSRKTFWTKHGTFSWNHIELDFFT